MLNCEEKIRLHFKKWEKLKCVEGNNPHSKSYTRAQPKYGLFNYKQAQVSVLSHYVDMCENNVNMQTMVSHTVYTVKVA